MRSLLLLLSLAGLSGSASGLQLQLVRSGGALGDVVTYDLSGDPGEACVLIPSLSSGPTALALVDPLDPRVLEVGLDLQPLWFIGALDGLGQVSQSYPLPGVPGLRGLPLFAQALTLPGASTLVDDVSNATGFALSGAGQSVNTVGDRTGPIDGHTATLLDDGRVALAGGVELVTSTTGVALDSFELFDPQTQTFSQAGGQMQHPRSAHVTVRLNDGRLLMVGGVDGNGDVVGTGDVWDPATQTAAPIPSMSSPRLLFTATSLDDGRVFVAGGLSLFDELDQFGTLNSALNTTEVYDPATNKIRFIDLHRSRYMDYVQDVSVFMVSNYRLQVLDAGTRTRIARVATDMHDMTAKFARREKDPTFEYRLALGLARSFASSTRFVVDEKHAKRMMLRARFILERALAVPKGREARFKLPIRMLFSD